MSKMMRRGSRGFTLIEMLIVIVVIAILALIVIPRLLGAGRKAKEASLKGDLHMLRNAIQQFEADTGGYPSDLDDLQLARASAPTSGVDDAGNAVSLDATAYQGPYLKTPDGAIPADPFTGAVDWTYSNGEVHSSSTLTALDGSDYADW